MIVLLYRSSSCRQWCCSLLLTWPRRIRLARLHAGTRASREPRAGWARPGSCGVYSPNGAANGARSALMVARRPRTGHVCGRPRCSEDSRVTGDRACTVRWLGSFSWISSMATTTLLPASSSGGRLSVVGRHPHGKMIHKIDTRQVY